MPDNKLPLPTYTKKKNFSEKIVEAVELLTTNMIDCELCDCFPLTKELNHHYDDGSMLGLVYSDEEESTCSTCSKVSEVEWDLYLKGGEKMPGSWDNTFSVDSSE